MNSIRIISDIHGNENVYLAIVNGKQDKLLGIKDTPKYSIQLGDLGFDYKFLRNYDIDSNRHCFVSGNHDNYDKLLDKDLCPEHYLGYWGQPKYLPNWEKMFFIGGAWSIDGKFRTPKLNWWAEEEMSDREMSMCFLAYSEIKPQIVFSHDCPIQVCHQPGFCNLEFARSMGYSQAVIENRTSLFLQKCFQFHRPQRWFFGHHHKNWEKELDGTLFRCINQYEYLDIEV